MATLVKPFVTGYGSSFGKFKGYSITDYTVSGDINAPEYNKGLTIDGVEFNLFEQTIRDYVLAYLGAPTIKVELTPFQLKIAIEEAISRLDYYAPYWSTQFAVFTTVIGSNLYELPKFMMNNLVTVYYKRALLTIAQAGSLEADFFLRYFQDNKFFSNFAVGDFYLLQQYLKQVRKVLSQTGTWDVISGKYLQLNPMPQVEEAVVIEYKALDSDTILPYFRNWIQKYALAICKGILGSVRRKYRTLPGPNGGAQLDGPDLIIESRDEKKALEEALLSEIQEPPLILLQ